MAFLFSNIIIKSENFSYIDCFSFILQTLYVSFCWTYLKISLFSFNFCTFQECVHFFFLILLFVSYIIFLKSWYSSLDGILTHCCFNFIVVEGHILCNFSPLKLLRFFHDAFCISSHNFPLRVESEVKVCIWKLSIQTGWIWLLSKLFYALLHSLIMLWGSEEQVFRFNCVIFYLSFYTYQFLLWIISSFSISKNIFQC